MVTAALLVVETVAQQYTELVGAQLHHSGDIKDVEEYRLVIIAPMWGKLGVTDLVTVQSQLVESQSTDAQLGFLDGTKGSECPSKNDTLP